MARHGSPRTPVRSSRRLHRALLVAFVCLVLFGPVVAAAVHGASSNASPPRRTCIGIDLGTSYSAAGVWRDGGVEMIPNAIGSRITPSVVSFQESERLVGDSARAAMGDDPARTIYAVKRLIGKPFTDPTVQEDRKALSYAVVDGGNDRAAVRVSFGGRDHVYTPEQISAMVLREVKATAEAHLGHAIDEAVITVPAYFNDAQRKATINAGRIAGLNVGRVLNEPTAAAMAYGLDRRGDVAANERNIVVYDLGGGTFDVSVLTVDDGFFEVLATGGDTHLGGEDFDAFLMEHLAAGLRRSHRIDVHADATQLARLRVAAEAAKRRLSSSDKTTVDLSDIVGGSHEVTVTRPQFEALIQALVRKSLSNVQRALDDAKITPAMIDDVVMIGGSTRIPFVRRTISNFFGGKRLHTSINPDEAVAYGAAVQAAVRCGMSDELKGEGGVVLVDITPLSLGIQVAGGLMHRVLPRGTQIPANATSQFTTFEDGQTAVRVKVYEGERAMAADNRLLGTFELEGIAPQPRGTPVIRVGFSVDANGVLTVTAADEANPRATQQLTITSSRTDLDEAAIAAMVAEAEVFAVEDDRIRQASEEAHELEALLQRSAQLLSTLPPTHPAVPALSEAHADAQGFVPSSTRTAPITPSDSDRTLALDRLRRTVAEAIAAQ
eukprot:CAMPEP_0174841286 /NCGR_PEP_ID=MMETSP1114-20130205/9209_1 /TAXON_ID=312471 /ORGANISM="Neobodo designis, Strain CCAP 1951/1" /LENGTH=664 /DNA_ID=CAMNT_0016075467 /DNA_START=80 /DNA_END=2074 /DNA_ORIENTATION=+